MKTFLGIDIGTTNCKVGIFDKQGNLLWMKSTATPMKTDTMGYVVCNIESFWKNIHAMLGEGIQAYKPVSIGITGMSEPGALINMQTGEPVTDIMLWNDDRSRKFSQQVSKDGNDWNRFLKTGLPNSHKYSVYKLLTELELTKKPLSEHHWLQTAPYIAYKLTGKLGIDPTLALRTYAFDIQSGTYDTEFLKAIGISENPFPPVVKSGEPMGTLCPQLKVLWNVEHEITVSICGHDHICALNWICDAFEDEIVLSLGTTGVLLGSFPKRPLTLEDFHSGYSFGLHPTSGYMTWLAAIQSAGSAVDWCHRLLGFEDKDYKAFDMIAAEPRKPLAGPLFFPYLSGSGAPVLDLQVRAGFLGLDLKHGPREMIHAVLEGIAYELRFMYENTPQNKKPKTIKVFGGGIKNTALLQIIADVLDCQVIVPRYPETTLAGAAMLAAQIHCHISGNQLEACYQPIPEMTKIYESIYQQHYLPLQKQIRQISISKGD